MGIPSKMDTIDSMCGTWSRLTDATTGFEEWAEAMQLPEELRKKAREQKEVTMVISRVGDAVTITTKYSVGDEVIIFMLDETCKHTSQGIDVGNVFTVKDGK